MFLPLGGEKRSFFYRLEKAEQLAARVGKHDDVHAEDDGKDVFHNIAHLSFLRADENREHDAGEEHDAADDQRDLCAAAGLLFVDLYTVSSFSSSITGQWSLPMTSGRMSAFSMRARRRSETIK